MPTAERQERHLYTRGYSHEMPSLGDPLWVSSKGNPKWKALLFLQGLAPFNDKPMCFPLELEG